jgi:hypothetical protein
MSLPVERKIDSDETGRVAMVFRIARDERLPEEETKETLSEKKLQANRANAKRSTGPKKTTVSRYNALRHGLRAANLSKLDYAAGYSELLRDLIEEKKPVGPIEMHFVEAIAFEMIRIPRARKIEADYINEWTYDPEPPVLYEGIVAPKLRTQRDVAETLLRTYQRYEHNYSAQLIKNLRELERLQMKRGDTVPAPLAVDVNAHIGATNNEDAAPPTIERESSKEGGDSVQ